MPVQLATEIPLTPGIMGGGCGGPLGKTNPWLVNAAQYILSRRDMQGGFQIFFHFFYCVRLRGFMACFVSYIICLCYCENCVRFCSYGFSL